MGNVRRPFGCSFHKVLLRAEQVLKKTPEEWLEFSAGQNTSFNLARFQTNPLVALFTQVFGFAYLIFASVRLRPLPIGQQDVLFLHPAKINVPCCGLCTKRAKK